MSQSSVQIDPMSTRSLLKYLGLAIEEIKLIRNIESISEQVRSSNSEHSSSRKHYLQSELRFLNKRLISLRAKAAKR